MTLLLISGTIAAEQNILELIDRSKEGRDILNAIYLELNGSSTLNRAKLYNIIKATRENASRTEKSQKVAMHHHEESCKKDIGVLHAHLDENQRNEFTVARHLNSNNHAIRKNAQYLARAKQEFNEYNTLHNILTNNKKEWDEFNSSQMKNCEKIINLMRRASKLLSAAHKKSHANAFIEMKGEYVTGLSEIRVELSSNNDNINGMRPIVNNLLQTMVEKSHMDKAAIREKVLRILHSIIRVMHERREELITKNDGAKAVFTALFKDIEENKVRVKKLQERLGAESKSLHKRQGALKDSRNRASNITKLSKMALDIRAEGCASVAARNAKILVSVEKSRNTAINVEEILQERFGELKGFFLQRDMKFTDEN
jgi:hypothetical protein